MSTRSGNLQCPFDAFLPLDIGKVILVAVEVIGEFGTGIDDGLFHHLLAVKMV